MKIYIYKSLIVLVVIFGFNGCGYTKLMQASVDGNLNLVKQEIKNGANIEEEGPNDSTALYFAASRGNLEILKLLVKSGANINHRPKFYTGLDIAVRNKHFNVVKFMIKNGANVNIKPSRYGTSPIMSIIEEAWKDNKYKYYYSNDTLQIAKYLVDNGARLSDLNTYNKAYYKEMTAAKNDFIRQYNKYITKINTQEKQKQIIVRKKEKKANEQKTVENYIANNNFQGLKNYTDKNPNAVYYIKDKTLRLMLTGPKGMKVGDIKKYIQNGKSDLILTSLINRVKEPYKEFTMQEIESLQKLGLSDTIISSMINITTKLLENKEKRKQQEFLLREQKRIANQKTKVIYKDNPNQKIDAQGNPIIEAVQDELIKQGAKMLFDKLF